MFVDSFLMLEDEGEPHDMQPFILDFSCDYFFFLNNVEFSADDENHSFGRLGFKHEGDAKSFMYPH